MPLKLPLAETEPLQVPAVRLLLNGGVQGCGLRPRLSRFAAAQGWGGFCRNTSEGVEVFFSAVRLTVPEVMEALTKILPPGYRVLSSEVVQDPSWEIPSPFRIEASVEADLSTAQLPLDVAVCPDCLQEVRQPSQRRHGYWLTTCATCGPRYSVLTDMPFDRSRTTLQAFPLCPECQREYDAPSDRRFHAQTIACANCGPRLWCADGHGECLETKDIIACILAVLEEGKIVAVRGVGGYQLWADATNQKAVTRLRERKHRPEKPLAVMCESVEQAEKIAMIDSVERESLSDPANPIVLLSRRRSSRLAETVSGEIGSVGVMLPTTPLHAEVLRRFQRPIVATSGNLEGEPLAVDPVEAERTLSGIADLFVHHDRPISHPLDDSVVRVMAGRKVAIRAARGLAPLPLPLEGIPPLIALGGHQKNSIAISNGGQSVLAPHVGDLESDGTRARWGERLDALQRLYGVMPEHYVTDHHSDYYPTLYAETSALHSLRVWHHHAHVAAGMVEQGWLDREVLGVAFDGTGLGPDGSIWGGEILRARLETFERVGSIRPFQLIGGEFASRQIFRAVAGVLTQLKEVPWGRIRERLQIPLDQWEPIINLCSLSRGSTTTSAGRLFDAAAAIILGRNEVQSEGFAAMCLESACTSTVTGAYRFDITEGPVWELDWRPAFDQLLKDFLSDASPSELATRFHRGLANGIVELSTRFGLPVVLGGGVFQNRFLVEAISDAWPESGPPLGRPGCIPPNDGGLAVGQLVIAASLLRREKGT
ncbi:MAG: carbamoyltransferase HypF [Planctomycetales bacterium]